MSKININDENNSHMNHCGIYMIKNLINDKVYIGMTRTSFKQRLKEHLTSLRSGTHYNIHLQNSFNKYGFDSFEFIILEIISKQENNLKHFHEREYDFMHYYNALSKEGYNLAFSKNKYFDLSKFDDKFLSENVRQGIRDILYEKELENNIIEGLLNLETVGEMIEYFYDVIADNEEEFKGFIVFLDKHLIKNKVNWKIDGFSVDTCKLNECIALDSSVGYCKLYECNINELNYREKQQCNNGQKYVEQTVNDYWRIKETWG